MGMREYIRKAPANKPQGYLPGSQIRPTDKWLSLRDLIIAMCQGLKAEGSRALAIKRPHCSSNEEDKLEQLREKQYLPAEKYPYLLLRFYDTYTYYIYI
jgi:hypothetical protein